MMIKAIRLSFVRIDTVIPPLASRVAPAIPFDFLLSEPSFMNELARAQSGAGSRRIPWHDGFASRFWFFYLEKRMPPKAKEAWRGLVPLECEVDGKVTAGWLPGTVGLRAYLYPWGAALLVDAEAKGSWSLDQAVDLAFQVHHLNKYECTFQGVKQLSLHALMSAVINAISGAAYGTEIPIDQVGEIFSLITVLDADGIDAGKSVEDKGDIHRALAAFTDWNQSWRLDSLKNLNESRLEIKQSPPSHLLFGARWGRAIWFPALFNTTTLTCYHQNLVAASLQTESLCRLINAAARQLAAGQRLVDFSVKYESCLRLAAGTLGRLHGGTLDTYRSHSVRDQINRTYEDSVNALRGELGMLPLNHP